MQDNLRFIFIDIPLKIFKIVASIMLVIFFIGISIGFFAIWAQGIALRLFIALLVKAGIINDQDFFIGKIHGFLRIMTQPLLEKIIEIF